MKKLRNNKGFTLIEIIAVMLILAVLGAVLVPKFINFDSNADKQSEAYMDAAVERKAYAEYYDGEMGSKGINLQDYIEKRIEEEREKRNGNNS